MRSLPSLWGQGLGGYFSAWVSAAGGSARMALVVKGFAAPESLVPKSDASSKAIADMRRAGNIEQVLDRPMGKTQTKPTGKRAE